MSKAEIDTVALRDYFLHLEEIHGVEFARDELIKFLKASTKEIRQYGEEPYSKFRGELAEILLEMYLMKYVRDNKGAFFVKSLCIEKGEKGGYSNYTELDVTLFTAGQVILFECKCYAGVKSLTEECNIVRQGRADMNVYGQSRHHLKHLTYYIDRYRNKNTNYQHKPYKLAYFELSLDATVDNRTKENKIRMPYLTENNIQSFLTAIPKGQVFDTQQMFNTIGELNIKSADNFVKHVKQLEANKR